MAIYFTQNTNSIEDIEQMNKVIEKVNNSNTTATVNISKLTDLNAKAEELSSNIQQALPINTELKENIKIGQPLVQEAVSKNTELQASLEKTKEFINGLDGSQNIPQLRLDVTELQNGLKSNQALEYQGSSISADNTLEGRTEGMKIKGKTMYKKKDGTYTDTWEEGVTLESFGEAEGNKISILSHGKNFVNYTMFKASNETKIEINADNIILEGNRAFANMSIKLSELNLTEGKTYYSKLDIENVSGNEAYYEIWINDKTTGKKSFIYKKGDKVSLFVFANRETFPSKNIIKNVIVSEKNEDNYEPCQSNKKDILIKEPLREGDYLYEDNGQVKVYRDVKQYTFTGDENISIRGEVKENTMSFAYAVKNNKSNALLCNNFKVLGGWDKDEERIWLDGTNLMFHIQKSKLTTPDVNGFKAWLKANPTTIVYQLATPTVEIVENCVDIDLDTFGEKTYFNILNSLPGTLDFKVPSNIASIVQNTAREVNNIWDVINNLLVPSLIDINKNVAMSTIKNNLK